MSALRNIPSFVILALTIGACSQQRHLRSDGGPDTSQDRGDTMGDQGADAEVDAPADGKDVSTEVVVDAPSGSVATGKPCSNDDNCMSGSCRDDVCCESKCEGTCVACSAAFTGLDNGVCGPVVSGMDPRGVCKDESDTSKCGQDGTCNGAGACRKQGPDRVCAPAGCSDGKFTASSTCDGKGTCVAGMVMPCGEFACAVTGCAKPCAGDPECPTGNFCANGTCKIKRIAGESCENVNQCGSGYCSPDKVCCDTACTGACTACTETLTGQKNGTCAPVQAGKDPKDDCAAEAPKSCGRDGTCDGKGGCRKFDSSVVCGEASCAGSMFSPAATCDSKGACAPVTPVSCGAAVCSSSGCSQTCTTDAQCVQGSYCVTASGSCAPKKANGVACSPGECASGACVDGVCCESACQGKCYGCSSDLTGQTSGRCLPIKEGRDPQNECDDSESTTCQQDGTCDGRGQCRKWPTLTPCATATCTADNKYLSARTCDGNGTCIVATVDPCGASKCELTGCKKACEGNADCIGTTYCDLSVKSCAAQKSQGSTCVLDVACVSQSCVDGVCCESACKSKCYACSFAKTTQPNGRCQPVAAGTDQDMECDDSPETSCGQDGTCDGNGQCRMWGSSAKCGPAGCSAGGFTPVSTCNGRGTCVTPAVMSCGLNTCDDVTGCRASCSATVPCATGSYCQIAGGAATGVCMAKRAGGEACQTGNECLLGFCADGVCCNEACTGTCYACEKSKTGLTTSGVCGARTTGTDDSRCAVDANACGQDGKCDGGGKCRKANEGKACKDAVCASNIYTPASSCNGQGTCVTPAAQSCAPSTCSNNGPCVTSCTMDNQCTTGSYCNPSTHMCADKKGPGEDCNGTSECKVGVCADGVCCNTACDKACQACNLTNSKGTCTPVTGAARHGSCAGADSACNGSCTGATDGLCAFPTISCGACKACSGGACQMARQATTRDCTSPLDNDCDGRADNTMDAVCKCVANDTQSCGAHPGNDGKGPCHAGTQTCVLAANKASSDWSTCGGSVGPAATDMCIFGNDDMCTGSPVGSPGNTQCQCGGFPFPNPASSGLPRAASYTDNGDGSIADNVTGLIWEKAPNPTAANCAGKDTINIAVITCTESEALAYCASKGQGWHLPTRKELISLVDFTVAPTINGTYFPNTAPGQGIYLTSTPYAGAADNVWFVEFRQRPGTSYVPASYSGAVRCVRTPSPKCYSARYQVQAGGIVYDAATGLTWQQNIDDAGGKNWNDAKAYCANPSLPGTGWRLPSYGELLSIVDETKTNPTIDAVGFPNTPAAAFWTSSLRVDNSNYAWIINFQFGFSDVNGFIPASTYRVRCVR